MVRIKHAMALRIVCWNDYMMVGSFKTPINVTIDNKESLGLCCLP